MVYRHIRITINEVLYWLVWTMNIFHYLSFCFVKNYACIVFINFNVFSKNNIGIESSNTDKTIPKLTTDTRTRNFTHENTQILTREHANFDTRTRIHENTRTREHENTNTREHENTRTRYWLWVLKWKHAVIYSYLNMPRLSIELRRGAIYIRDKGCSIAEIRTITGNTITKNGL